MNETFFSVIVVSLKAEPTIRATIDSVLAQGCQDFEIIVKDGFSQNFVGKLAGTTTMLDAGWHSLMSCGHLSETKSAQAVTRNPAEHFSLFDRGQLLPGLRADLAIFEQDTNRPLTTVRRGEIIAGAMEQPDHVR